MTNEEMYRILEARLDKIEKKLDCLTSKDTCKAIRASCDEKVDLKFKNLRLWVIALLGASGVNVAATTAKLAGLI